MITTHQFRVSEGRSSLFLRLMYFCSGTGICAWLRMICKIGQHVILLLYAWLEPLHFSCVISYSGAGHGILFLCTSYVILLYII